MKELQRKESLITKTVRFGLTNYSLKSGTAKNDKYNNISKKFKNNSKIKDTLEKYELRVTESSNPEEWKKRKVNLLKKIQEIKIFVKEVSETLENIDNLKSDSKYNYCIIFKTSRIRKSCGFGKSLFFNQEGEKNISEFFKDENIENIRKYSVEYNACKNKFEAYRFFIESKIKFVDDNLENVERLLQSENHEKARLAVINCDLQKVIGILNLVYSVYLSAISFNGNIKEKVSKIRDKINQLKKEYKSLNTDLEKFLEEIHNPKHGYEIGKATVHYRTINKRFIPENEIATVEKLLGKDSLKGDEFNNPLAQFSFEILKIFKGEIIRSKGKDRRLEIEKGGSIIEKSQKVIDLVRKIDGINKEDVTLWNICNALNNKNQTYDKFITQEEEFENLGYKQKLKFGLTVLVDCDVYRPKKFIKRCNELKPEVLSYINNKIKFKRYYDSPKKDKKGNDKKLYGYKSFTQKIKNKQNIKKNAQERGKLITKALRDYTLVNKEISKIRGALEQYLKYLTSVEGHINMIQYFAVLAKGADNEDLLLLIERNKAKEFYQKINSKHLTEGKEKIYLYDSLTEKALKKLFNQIYSQEHPFKTYKKEIQKKKNIEIDRIKFENLSLYELKRLFKKDIALQEKWQERFPEFYKKISNFKDKQELLQDLTKNAFQFEEKKVDLQELQQDFKDLIVARLEMNTNQKKQSIHKTYFDRALKKMLKHKDVDAKINPEFQIYFTPQKDKEVQKKKIQDILSRGFEYNSEEITTEEQAKDFCEKEHRFFRKAVTVGIPIEIDTKKKTGKELIKRFIGIDRGEKKIATLCVLEKNDKGEFIIPLEYYENSGDWKNPNWQKKQTYFLDLAQFKIGRINGEQKILKWQNEDKNLELKKYEFITRFIKTIWIGDNRNKNREILASFDENKLHDENYVRTFIEEITGTDKEMQEGQKGKIFNNHGLKAYQENILLDSFVLEKIAQTIVSFNEFDFTGTDTESILKQQELELNKVRFRDTVASNIAGIINFMFAENKKNSVETFCVMENLHNSRYINFFSEDKTNGQKLINDDFVEASHNKLYQTGVYGKIEQAIMSKLQIFNDKNNRYLNYSFIEKRKNQWKEIQLELKQYSNLERDWDENFQGNSLKIQPAKLYGNIIFVDPRYTSLRCPKCGAYGPSNVSRSRSSEDKVSCKKCGYKSQSDIRVYESVKLSKAYSIISTGDENGAFFIAFRGMNSLS